MRISGPQARYVLEKLAGKVPEPRSTALRAIRTTTGELLDQALVIFFENGHSFTGEDVAEIHLHGSPAIIRAVQEEFGKIGNLRLAEPGEFTRRALENGRLDLAQVEGLADLINAETEVQRRQAARVFAGEFGKRVEQWRSLLIRAAALLEASIDFADEEVPEDVTPEVILIFDDITREFQAEIRGSHVSERIRDGFEVAIIGAPNVGKSTLLNALAGRDAAITSEIAGTTRDVIEVRMDLRGLPVTFLDTAGLRETENQIERLGIQKAIERAKHADLRLFLVEGEVQCQDIEPDGDDILIEAKADLRQTSGFAVSGKTGQGIGELIEKIASILEKRTAGAAMAIRERHRQAIEKALRNIAAAREMIVDGPRQIEVAAEETRSAIRAVESLVGRIDVEHVLDEIFASFCLGK